MSSAGWKMAGALCALTACSAHVRTGGSAAAPAAELDPAGSYRIVSSSNPEGGPSYAGRVTVSSQDEAYAVAWELEDGSSYDGVGLVQDGLLAVAWGSGAPDSAVVVYAVSGGKLDGRWVRMGEGKAGTEVLEGPPGLEGTYTLTSASDPGGTGYTGKVDIERTGDTYALTWTLPDQTTTGVGVLEGSTLVVGWNGAGAVIYRSRATRLEGRWASPGGRALGTEVLERQ